MKGLTFLLLAGLGSTSAFLAPSAIAGSRARATTVAKALKEEDFIPSEEW